jgi:hypothetical protein
VIASLVSQKVMYLCRRYHVGSQALPFHWKVELAKFGDIFRPLACVSVTVPLSPILAFLFLPDGSTAASAAAAAAEISDEEVIDNDCDNITETGNHSLDGLVLKTSVHCVEFNRVS